MHSELPIGPKHTHYGVQNHHFHLRHVLMSDRHRSSYLSSKKDFTHQLEKKNTVLAKSYTYLDIWRKDGPYDVKGTGHHLTRFKHHPDNGHHEGHQGI